MPNDTREHFTKEDLLRVIYSWDTMIRRNGEKYPTACLNDLQHSIEYVLSKEGVLNDNE